MTKYELGVGLRTPSLAYWGVKKKRDVKSHDACQDKVDARYKERGCLVFDTTQFFYLIGHLKKLHDDYHFTDGNSDRYELSMAWEAMLVSATEAGEWCRNDLRLIDGLSNLHYDEVTYPPRDHDQVDLGSVPKISDTPRGRKGPRRRPSRQRIWFTC